MATSTIATRCPNLPRLCRAEFDVPALVEPPFLRLAVARVPRMGRLAPSPCERALTAGSMVDKEYVCAQYLAHAPAAGQPWLPFDIQKSLSADCAFRYQTTWPMMGSRNHKPHNVDTGL